MNRRLFVSLLGSSPFLLFEACSTKATEPDPVPVVPIPNSFLWLGTSIPGLGGYPELIAKTLGATVVNNAIGSSVLRSYDKNHSWVGMAWENVAYALTHTIAQKQYIIDNWATLAPTFGYNPPATLSEPAKGYILSCSYENRLMPYLDGRKEPVGYIILSHGYNDTLINESVEEFKTMPANSRNLDTYLGSMNFIIDLIQKYQPNTQIIIEGHYENQKRPHVSQAQEVIAAYRKLPIIRTWQKTDWTQERVPTTQKLWSIDPWKNFTDGAETTLDMTKLRVALPDDVHPHADKTGKARDLLANVEIGLMSQLGIADLAKLTVGH